MTEPTHAATVLIVDDHPVVLDGVTALLAGMQDLEVVGTTSDRAAAITEAARLQPTLVLLDLRMHGGYAPDTPARIKAAAPRARILLHTATEEIEPVRASLAAGADGVVYKDGRLLVEALRAVAAGEAPYLDPRFREREREPEDGRAGVQVLSPREYELLRAFAAGQSTREIAQSLFLTESTVRSYVKSLFTKLGVHSRIEALAQARRLSLI